jgi:hypothetical protein
MDFQKLIVLEPVSRASLITDVEKPDGAHLRRESSDDDWVI